MAAACASTTTRTYYKTIYNWIAQGVPFGDPAEGHRRRLQVEPKEIVMTKPGETATVKVIAHLCGRRHARRHPRSDHR